MPRPDQIYSLDEREAIISRYLRGDSIRQVAAYVGGSYTGVRRILENAGVEFRRVGRYPHKGTK